MKTIFPKLNIEKNDLAYKRLRNKSIYFIKASELFDIYFVMEKIIKIINIIIGILFYKQIHKNC